MKIMSIIGARPQFIKAAPVSKKLREHGFDEILVHTGQHYDSNMSRIFFDELQIPLPEINLGIGSGSHGWQTAQMLMEIEKLILKHKPDGVVVYGDTNSTLAGALAACKLHIKLAHVEAGLRSFNKEMPEEHNRRLTDHCSDILFCPTRTAVENLADEGICDGISLAGDTMYDSILQFKRIAIDRSNILQEYSLNHNEFYLVTLHRPYNVDNSENLFNILTALNNLDRKVVFPVHPRTRAAIGNIKKTQPLQLDQLILIEPVGYIDMLALEQNARIILTDSGGIQKEAYFLKVPCITVRPETEWIETVESGWNVVVGVDTEKIIETAKFHNWPDSQPPPLFGNGDAASKIVDVLSNSLS